MAIRKGDDKFGGKLPDRLSPEIVKNLCRVSNVRGIAAIALQWSSIFLVVWLCESNFNPLLYALTIVFVATRQHALGVLAHDGVHFLLNKSRKINNFLGDGFCALPLSLSIVGYRRQHFEHHRRVGKQGDPDFDRIQGKWRYQFPKTTLENARILFLYITGVYGIPDIKDVYSQLLAGLPRQYNIVRLLYYAAVAGALYLLGWLWEALIYWYVPLVFVLPYVLYFRLIAEHSAVRNNDGVGIYATTRHVDASIPERLLISPLYVNYHLDHHIYPQVPHYRLPELHRQLLQLDGYRSYAHLTEGYFRGLMNELKT